MTHFIIYGEIASKKNNKRILYKYHGNKKIPFIASSERYIEWNKDAKQQLQMQKNLLKDFCTNRCKLIIQFYYGSNISKDADNGTSSVFDTLKDVGIVPDDNWHVIYKYMVEAYYDKIQPRVEVFIYEPDEEVIVNF